MDGCPGAPDALGALDDALLQALLSRVDARDLPAASRVCRRWRCALRAPALCRCLHLSLYGGPAPADTQWPALLRGCVARELRETPGGALAWMLGAGHAAGARRLLTSAGAEERGRLLSSSSSSGSADGDLPLNVAAASGACGPDVASMLVGLGADVNAKGNRGRTALHVAAFYGRDDVAGRLVELGADTRAREDTYQQTPMHIAASRASVPVLRLLHAVDPTGHRVPDRDRFLPINVAAYKNLRGIVEMIQSWM
eukprot:m51a1_g1535 hypothetical protein (255) ;mRNA; r:536604-537524